WLHGAWVLLLIVVAVAWFVLNQSAPPPPVPPTPPAGQGPDSYTHLRWGNPSGAREDLADRDNYLMRKPYFALSYNDAKGTPNWVSWCLKHGDFRPAKRVDAFHPDESLPRGFRKVRPADYNGTGFDRGHLCPNGDRMGDDAAAEATFVMTNMIPQSPNCNQKAWADLEE